MTRKDLKLYRGDTYDATLSIDNYTPSANDTILFGIKESFDGELLVRKEIDPTAMTLHLKSEDTQDLPKRCVYDAQLTFVDDKDEQYTKTFLYGNITVTKDVVV